jgi:glycosyltransferase involved in cell wall biosynthesis
MQVLWISHLVPYPPKSGALLRAYYLLRAVAARHQVDLVAFVQEPLLASFYPDMRTALEDCRANLSPMCRSVTFVPIGKLTRPMGKVRTALESLFTRDGYMANWLGSKAAARTLRQLCETHHYQVAHFDHESLALYRDVCASMPATLGHHNAESHMLLRRADNESRLPARLYFRHEGRKLERYERRIAARFGAHVTCSPLDSERLAEVMPDARFHSIPNGVDVDYFVSRGAAKRPQSMIFVSSMSWYPNVDAVLFLLREIWPRVLAKMPAATLDIVGANAPESVRQAAQQRGVTLHGYVPDIRPLMDSAEIYVCPVRDGGGTKLKVLDALAMGMCLVAHPVACEGIAVTPSRDVIFANTPDEFATRIFELSNAPAQRAALGAAAREVAVNGYSFASIGAAFNDVLEQVAGGK